MRYSEGEQDLVDVHVDGVTGKVLEVWTGPQATPCWRGATRRRSAGPLNAWYVWLPLALLFLAPFVDPRRPFRLLHLDLAVLLGFGASQYFFNQRQIDASVPLA